MQPRFVGRLGLADAVTTLNAGIGFAAVATAVLDINLAARLILLAAIADGLDGLIAEIHWSSEVGPYLDGLADVASFGVAPGMLVYTTAWTAPIEEPWRPIVAIGLPAVFVGVAVIRLGLYTVHDAATNATEGVQSTLAGTVLAAAVLAGVGYLGLLAWMAAFCYLMVVPVEYPDLFPRDALIMGVVQALAVLAPTMWEGLFPKALFVWAVLYLVFGPWLYWR